MATNDYGSAPYATAPYAGGTDDATPMSSIIITSTTDSERTSYEFEVDGGAIEKNSDLGSIQGNDKIDGSTASGQVWGGTDAYNVEGEIIAFSPTRS